MPWPWGLMAVRHRATALIDVRQMNSVLHPEAEYTGFLSQGRFMLQRSVSTGDYVFYPRVAQPGTGLADLEWVEASGEGTIYSFTIVRNKPPAESYVIALVDLSEGVRLMTRIVEANPAAIQIGMAVRARVGDVDGEPAVLFAPLQERGK